MSSLSEASYKDYALSLSRIAVAINSEKNLQKLYQIIIDEAISLAGCDACSLFAREYEPDQLVFQATRTLSLERRNAGPQKHFDATPVELSKKSLAGYVALTGNLLNIEDAYSIPSGNEYGFNSQYDDRNGYKTKSVLAIPMMLNDGTIIGVIQLMNKLAPDGKVTGFPEDLVEIVTAIASQAAVGIHNSRLKHIQSQASFIFIAIVMTLCVYTFALGIMKAKLDNSGYTITTMILSLFMVGISVGLIRKSRLPIQRFGITTMNLGQSLRESAAVTAVTMVAIVGVRLWANPRYPELARLPLIDFGHLDWTSHIYAIVAPVQEFIGRGVLQSTIERIVPGKSSAFWAVIVAATLFSTAHIHYSIALALVSLVSGIIWGFTFLRHRNIIGISISHYILGMFAILVGF